MCGVGFEPTKHNAIDLESIPFDQARESAQKKMLAAGLEPATFGS
jgi:hypothetical protein